MTGSYLDEWRNMLVIAGEDEGTGHLMATTTSTLTVEDLNLRFATKLVHFPGVSCIGRHTSYTYRSGWFGYHQTSLRAPREISTLKTIGCRLAVHGRVLRFCPVATICS